MNCSNLQSLILPINLKFIGSYAFYNCDNLSQISIYKMTAPQIKYNTFEFIRRNGTLTVL